MNMNDTVTGYQKWMNPLAKTVRLGAPAATNGGGWMGLTYLKTFLAQSTGCHIDFVPVHWYGDASDSPDLHRILNRHIQRQEIGRFG